jgi:hypothetical protein
MALGTDPTPDTTKQDQTMTDLKQAHASLHSEIRALASAFQNRKEPEPQPAPVINVHPANVTIEKSDVHVDAPTINNNMADDLAEKIAGAFPKAEAPKPMQRILTHELNENGDIIRSIATEISVEG